MLQGADNSIPKGFYKIAVSYISENTRVLNLGCGRKFTFEKLLSQKKNVYIESMDILSSQKPSFVNKFTSQDVEKPFLLEEKFDIITFFELIEHIDKTDILIENCINNLKQEGLLIFSFPNLASLYCRLELLLGFQPHILEISNKKANFGTHLFGKLNNPKNEPIHHIRGITYIAMKELIQFYGFKIKKIYGYEYRLKGFFGSFPSLAPVDIFICKKL